MRLVQRVQTAYRNLKIRHKLVLAIYIVLLPALLISTAFLYRIDYESTMDENSELYERFTQNACTEISYLQRDVVDILTYFAVNDEIGRVLALGDEYAETSSLLWYERTPVAFLQNMLAIKSHIKTLVVYPENGIPPFYISRDSSVHAASIDSIRNTADYARALDARGDIVWTKIEQGKGDLYDANKSDKIVAYRELYDLSKQRRLAFVAVGMDASEYRRICSETMQEDGEGILVTDSASGEFVRTGQINENLLGKIQSPEVQQILVREGSYHFLEDHTHVFLAKSEESGVQVCYMSPESIWTAKARSTLVFPIVLALILLISAVPLSTFISRSIFKSTDLLCRSMEAFRQGDFTQSVEVGGNDEIAVLTRAFNDTVQDIRTLIDKNYVMALRERESELNALQAQINPHFLYNVLDSLYWQAEEEGNDNLAENILTLSQLFRLLLSQGQNEIPVEREAELVRCYLDIQKMRFGDRLTTSVEITEDAARCMIPKLTLQPIVENAIVHGLEHQTSGGTVRVSGRKDGNYLIFVIEDNGVGMDQSQTESILSGQNEKKYAGARVGHFAIRNIKERLTLRYGENFKVEVKSALGRGTRVSIRIPAEESKV